MKKHLLSLGALLLVFCTACQHRGQVRAAHFQKELGGPVYFEFGRWTLSSEEEKQLMKKVSVLKSHPGATVILEGYTDAIGSEEGNLQLGDRRARFVEWRLSTEGVRSDNLVVVSYGKGRLLNPSLEAAARSRERRVELRVK